MSLTSAIGAARSGLATESIRADLHARNISNSGTKGYTRKTADVITIGGGGASVAGIERHVDTLLDRLDRGNISKLAGKETIRDGMTAYTDFLGQPTDETSPVASFARLKSAFITLSTGVSDLSAQMAAVSAGRDVSDGLNALSDTLNAVGDEVEMNIRYEVSDLNDALYSISKLNGRLASEPSGTDARVRIEDEMDGLLDKVSSALDVQISTSSNGMVNLITGGGAELVTGRDVQDVTYDPVAGRLSAGDRDITPGAGQRSFTDGTLAGLFELRNEVIPGWSGQLDTMAAALVEGFGRVSPINGGPGLFTDDGAVYDPAAIEGLAGRISINADVDPDLGGDPGLLQSGGDPATPIGDSSMVDAMVRLFSEDTQIAGREFGESQGLTLMVSAVVGSQQKQRASVESSVTAISSSANTISASRENLRGVNMDEELQKLLVVEQSYAANAKVMTTVTNMIDSLLQAV